MFALYVLNMFKECKLFFLVAIAALHQTMSDGQSVCNKFQSCKFNYAML